MRRIQHKSQSSNTDTSSSGKQSLTQWVAVIIKFRMFENKTATAQ